VIQWWKMVNALTKKVEWWTKIIKPKTNKNDKYFFENPETHPTTMNNFVDAAIATTLAEVITLPICTLKTNYQNTQSKSWIETASTMYHKGGIKMFYVASMPAIASQVFSTSSKYFLYRKIEEQNLFGKFGSGLVSGVLSSLITHPIDVIKIHKQMDSPFLSELQKNGIKVFYRGYDKTLGKVSIGSMLFFPLFDLLNKYFSEQTNSFIPSHIKAGLCSSIISTTLIHPCDYLKTRHIYGLPLFEGWNPKVYFKGLSLNLFRVVPHFTLVMTTISVLSTRR
jgi:hypothetical protein